MNYCIIGNSAAAIGAVEGIRKIDQDSPITVISAESYHTYSRPLISYYLAGKVPADKMYYRPLDFYEKNNVTLLANTEAAGIDTEKKEVLLQDQKSVHFDKLLIATGGKPFIPPTEGLDKKGIYTFQKWDDVKGIAKVAGEKKSKAVIIGAGLIGMKAAEALRYLGIEVTVIELANRVLSSILDTQAASFVQDVMESHGTRFILGSTVSRILGDKQVSGVEVSNGKILDCDLLIFAIGVVPNNDVVSKTTIKTNRGILINEKMETSIPGIYAAGDVAEGQDAILNSARVIPILPNAYKQGETAGQNMAGSDVSFTSGFAMNAIGFFGYAMTSAGVLGGEGYEELMIVKPEESIYRKVIFKDDRLVGYIALKEINRTGMLTGLIADKINVQSFKQSLLKPDFGYIDWPKELRCERMLSGGEG